MPKYFNKSETFLLNPRFYCLSSTREILGVQRFPPPPPSLGPFCAGPLAMLLV